MSEQEDAVADLSGAGVLTGIYWAGASAYRRVMADYDPDTGHKSGWVGYSAHVLLCDRLDRVFSCGDYHLSSGADSGSGLDVLSAGLAEIDTKSMPNIAPGTVTYAPLNNSPGWRFGPWRWLLSSFPFGESRKIQWAAKSETKRRVASHPNPDQPSLFGVDSLFEEHLVSVPLVPEESGEDLVTLVLAHSIHKELRQREFYLGRPNIEPRQAWHWIHDIMANPPGEGGGLFKGGDDQPDTPNPNEEVSDAPLRLRETPKKHINEHKSNETSG